MFKHIRIALFLAFIAGVTGIAGALAVNSPSQAQSTTPQQVSATIADTGTEAIVRWQPNSAAYLRVGWVSETDLRAVTQAGGQWLDAFAFTDVANTGQRQYLVKNLSPNTRYAFIVASVDQRFGAAAWSEWAYATTPAGQTQVCPTPVPTPAPPQGGVLRFEGTGNDANIPFTIGVGRYTISGSATGAGENDSTSWSLYHDDGDGGRLTKFFYIRGTGDTEEGWSVSERRAGDYWLEVDANPGVRWTLTITPAAR